MTQAQHTQGPWSLIHVPAQIHEDGSQTIEHWKVEADGWEIYNTAFMPVSREEREANARLIAAAPRMLKHLEHLTNQLASCGESFLVSIDEDFFQDVCDAQDVIADARRVS